MGKRQYKAGLKPKEKDLRRQLNAIKRQQFPWMLGVTKNAPQMAIIHLGQTFQNFFAGRAKYPTFKKKGRHDTFSLTNDQFSIQGKQIWIPNLGFVWSGSGSGAHLSMSVKPASVKQESNMKTM